MVILKINPERGTAKIRKNFARIVLQVRMIRGAPLIDAIRTQSHAYLYASNTLNSQNLTISPRAIS